MTQALRRRTPAIRAENPGAWLKAKLLARKARLKLAQRKLRKATPKGKVAARKSVKTAEAAVAKNEWALRVKPEVIRGRFPDQMAHVSFHGVTWGARQSTPWGPTFTKLRRALGQPSAEAVTRKPEVLGEGADRRYDMEDQYVNDYILQWADGLFGVLYFRRDDDGMVLTGTWHIAAKSRKKSDEIKSRLTKFLKGKPAARKENPMKKKQSPPRANLRIQTDSARNKEAQRLIAQGRAEMKKAKASTKRRDLESAVTHYEEAVWLAGRAYETAPDGSLSVMVATVMANSAEAALQKMAAKCKRKPAKAKTKAKKRNPAVKRKANSGPTPAQQEVMRKYMRGT